MAQTSRVNWVWLGNSKRDFSHIRGIVSKLPSVQGTMLYWSGDLDVKIIIVLKVTEVEWIQPWLNCCIRFFSTSEEELLVCQADFHSDLCLPFCPCLHLHDGLCLLSCMCKTEHSCMRCMITDVYHWFRDLACRPVLHCCHLKTEFESTAIWSAITQHTVLHLHNTYSYLFTCLLCV